MCSVLKKKERWCVVCLRVIQKPLLISRLGMDYFFRKASASLKHFVRQAKQFGAIESDSPAPAHGFIFIRLECRWNANQASHRLPLSISYILLFCASRTEFSSHTTITPFGFFLAFPAIWPGYLFF